MKSERDDYLKFWRVIRFYIKAKHGLTQADLDVILFLYSEKYFDRDKFDEFNELLSWDVNRFNRLLHDGWVSVFRKRTGKRKALYELSYKGTRLCLDIYRKLNGEEIPTSLSYNSMFLKNVSYSDKVYRNMIRSMNAYIKETNLEKRNKDE
jgi:hypothetical protein